MTLPEIQADIIKFVQGGKYQVGSKFDSINLQQLILQYRAIQLGIAYKKESRINPLWTQNYQPDFDKDLQDEKNVIKFRIPPVVRLDEFTLGFLYIGSTDCLNNYRLLRSRAELSTYSKHRVYRKSKVPVCIYSDGILEVHNRSDLGKIDLRIDSVFENPLDIPTYHPDLSQFPLDFDNIVNMKQLIIKLQLGIQASTPIKQVPANIDITNVK